MSTIDRFSITAAMVDGYPLDVTELSVTLSDTWAPYVHGVVVCTLPPMPIVLALDPRAALPPELVVQIVRSFGDDGNRVSEWTEQAGAPTVKISEWTALGAGAADWSTANAAQYNAEPRSGQEMHLRLTVDEVQTDERAQTMTLTIGGRELRLQEVPAFDSRTLLGPRIRDAVNEALVLTNLGRLGAGEGMTPYSPPVWPDGQPAWDALHSWLDAIEHRLIWDEQGQWRVISRDTTRPGTPVVLEGLKELSRKLTRADWFDSVEVRWTWETINPGTGQTVKNEIREPSTWSASWTKPLIYEMQGPPKGSGMANDLWMRYSRKGEKHAYTAPADLGVRPLDRVPITDSAGTRNAVITSVTLNFPAAELTVETREA